MQQAIKSVIEEKFDNAAKTYDQYALIQKNICDYCVSLIKEYCTTYSQIADFACGTGESLLSLHQNIMFDYCCGIDISRNSLAIAEKKLRFLYHIDLLKHDYEKRVPGLANLDLIFCNMGVQWSCDINATLALWRTYLSDHGIIAITLPLVDNFPEIHPSCKPIFPSHEDLVIQFNQLGFTKIAYKTLRIQQAFKNQVDILRSLKFTGTNFNKKHVLTHQRGGLTTLSHMFVDKQVKHLTYHVGIYVVKKL